jgi:hypothetical protein
VTSYISLDEISFSVYASQKSRDTHQNITNAIGIVDLILFRIHRRTRTHTGTHTHTHTHKAQLHTLIDTQTPHAQTHSRTQSTSNVVFVSVPVCASACVCLCQYVYKWLCVQCVWGWKTKTWLLWARCCQYENKSSKIWLCMDLVCVRALVCV